MDELTKYEVIRDAHMGMTSFETKREMCSKYCKFFAEHTNTKQLAEEKCLYCPMNIETLKAFKYETKGFIALVLIDEKKLFIFDSKGWNLWYQNLNYEWSSNWIEFIEEKIPFIIEMNTNPEEEEKK